MLSFLPQKLQNTRYFSEKTECSKTRGYGYLHTWLSGNCTKTYKKYELTRTNDIITPITNKINIRIRINHSRVMNTLFSVTILERFVVIKRRTPLLIYVYAMGVMLSFSKKLWRVSGLAKENIQIYLMLFIWEIWQWYSKHRFIRPAS